MTEDSYFKNNPLHMMIRANELGRLVERLEAEQRDGVWEQGTSIAVPILLSLAVEIGLKAWHRNEGNVPPFTHDLLVLFDSLGENTRRRLEVRMPEIPSGIPGYPVYPGIRDALRQNRKMFEEWRYVYEHEALFAQTSVLQTALKAIVDELIVKMPPGRRLKG